MSGEKWVILKKIIKAFHTLVYDGKAREMSSFASK